jgi:hypothetical protein
MRMKTRFFVAAVVVLSASAGSARAELGPTIQTASLQFRFGIFNSPPGTPLPQARFRRHETDPGATKQNETRTCLSRLLGRVACPAPKSDQTRHDETKTCNTRAMARPFPGRCATPKQDQAKLDQTTTCNSRGMVRPFLGRCATPKQDRAKLDQTTTCNSRGMVRPLSGRCATPKQDRADLTSPAPSPPASPSRRRRSAESRR